jgi:uncharacterized protein
MPAPLFIKYRTKRNKNYLYDCATGYIVEVDNVIYSIIDDWHILKDNEILKKYSKIFEEEKIRIALQELLNLQHDHLFIDHVPCELSRVERIFYDRQEWEIGEFWQRAAMLLVLGITERCNLCCTYCCFSGKFTGQRTHSSRSMDWEIARKAISDFLENDQVGDGTYPITFYGGEPLLEFSLLQDSVQYAEKVAKTQGKTNRFAITTNGTLLTDDIIDYLVKHHFLIMISLDGPKEIHDRYRVFSDKQGSFDTIIRNLNRFIERYPFYKNRGLNITLAPPLDLKKTTQFVEEFFPHYPLTRASLVNTGTEYRFRDSNYVPTQYGCHSESICKKNLLVDSEQELFRQFELEDQEELNKLWNTCMESLATVGTTETWKTLPVGMMLFEAQIRIYHNRVVTEQPLEWAFFLPCIPGLNRRFVDAKGNYRVCERCDNSDAYILGHVQTGLDVTKLERTLELRRHFGDCGNCSSLKVCDVCYARIPESDAVKNGFDPFFDLQCQRTRAMTPKLLQTYTEIMEANPKAFDYPIDKDFVPFKKLKYGSPTSRLDQDILEKLNLEIVHI